MPNPGADRPLRKVTINLYEDDVAAAELAFGYGWSATLREEWHLFITRTLGKRVRRTVGEFDDD